MPSSTAVNLTRLNDDGELLRQVRPTFFFPTDAAAATPFESLERRESYLYYFPTLRMQELSEITKAGKEEKKALARHLGICYH